MIIFVDSSVWIDLLGNRETLQVRALTDITRVRGRLLVNELVLTEVLQGTRSQRDFDRTLEALSEFDSVPIGGPVTAIQAARNYHLLRARGITIRKTIDTLIATYCILNDIPLLYSDRDFDPFVTHLGLRSAMDELPGVN